MGHGDTVTHSTLLRAVDLTKSYAGVHALRRASLSVRAGEVHAVVGENGAGKSTLIKIITGAIERDSGDLVIAGRTIDDNSPRFAKELGVAAIYQQPALFPELTVAENIAIALEPQHAFRRVDWRARRTQAEALLARVGARIDPDVEAGSLSMPEQQLVEIARALGANAKLLILDEPTASLSAADADHLLDVLRELRRDGVGMIYISHRLEELGAIADRVTVLRDGTTIETRAMAEVTTPELIRMMVGRELSAVFPKRDVPRGDVVLEIRALGSRDAGVRDVSFAVHAGEIVGVAGLVGAGRTELARTLFGITPADAGEIRLRGKPVAIDTPARAIAEGIAYVPEDRRRHGVVMALPVGDNVTLSSLSQFVDGLGFDTARERSAVAEYVQRLAIKTPSIFTPVSDLSGGNQQKVAVSRWLLTDPAVLILDEPTQGIDVGAKSEIHALMVGLAARGVAIVMISSELPEVLGMSDRIVVMRAGTVAGIVDRADATPAGILALALGDGGDPTPGVTQ